MKTQAEIDAANQWQAYQRGWAAGAAVRAMDAVATKHDNVLIRDAYSAGYRDGGIARRNDLERASKHYGYTPSVLRLQNDDV